MKRKILVVDDDKKTVDLIRLSLEKEQFEALVAYEGIEALTLTRCESPDLMILDWMLPNIAGLDLCRIVRSESNIPVIMLTARATEDDKLLDLYLVEHVFGPDYDGLDRTVDFHLVNLRKKIEADPDQPPYLQTVYGIGYKFRRADDAE